VPFQLRVAFESELRLSWVEVSQGSRLPQLGAGVPTHGGNWRHRGLGRGKEKLRQARNIHQHELVIDAEWHGPCTGESSEEAARHARQR